ncbi:MAG: family 20 glycosylhydrolase, partial [Gemmatimonadales bacterium]|nr:family 20 glycosylhydrolase [Gemmatimonadales bacterium]NIN12154.1 family 20 glycosylhydrolase [Gemmatimonadales bacterium]NIN50575.1 family 20 glycosylhydrolase [Gemmatimonadales bacterium]NIP08039.1 family 20 glycosylhydrolase [Gemmatimonadales bacterium]NIR00621.1 family 20 glycosylhydrolase [Gemmatimonadales bacterium]
MPELARYQLIPFPAHIEPKPDAFLLTGATTIAVSHLDDEELRSLADYGADLLRTMTGVNVAISDVEAGGDMDGTIALVLSRGGPSVSPEAYHLAVTPASITISAAAHPGLFYGLQTLRQLLPSDGSHRSVPQGVAWAVPAVEITDQPRFQYRGMHLDVGRHFFPVPFIKNYIDLLAMYKMNTFHWHLTEDQGWRIEIKKYPRLTEVGGFRKETILEKNFDPYIGDGIPYGGFYTQEEIREVVAHARARYVAVIPEIEMPGHSTAALAAYPEFACTEGPFEVSTKWGVHQDIYCPSEETFAFLQDVLTEVMDLFPSRYIHIGGDEAPKIRWQESQLAQDVIRREGLTDEHELQSYFIKRIEEFLLTNGRRLIGWDEILEGGLAPEATVMSWRGMRGGIEAAREGHDVIMTPTSHVYFDYYQGDPENEPLAIGGYTPLERVYEFEPVPTELTAEEAEHVLGAQGNVWTEYMKTTDYVEYMVVPRLLALAEVVWSTTEMRYWDWFAARLQSHFRRLDDLDINYRIP